MFKLYEKSVLALSNYTKFYGIDTKDEIVFKEYLNECKKKKIDPSPEITGLFDPNYEDKSLYCIPDLKLIKKLRTTIQVDYSMDINSDMINTVVPNVVEHDILNEFEDDVEMTIINLSATQINKDGIKDKLISNYDRFINKSKSIDLVIEVRLSRKIDLKSDEYENLIANALSAYGNIKISAQWEVLESSLETNEEDIIIVERDF